MKKYVVKNKNTQQIFGKFDTKNQAAKVEGKDSVAIVTGKNSKAAGALGCWLVLTERGEWNGEIFPIKEVRAVKVDGDAIRAELIDGEVKEVK